jgi:hypothetical protein
MRHIVKHVPLLPFYNCDVIGKSLLVIIVESNLNLSIIHMRRLD